MPFCAVKGRNCFHEMQLSQQNMCKCLCLLGCGSSIPMAHSFSTCFSDPLPRMMGGQWLAHSILLPGCSTHCTADTIVQWQERGQLADCQCPGPAKKYWSRPAEISQKAETTGIITLPATAQQYGRGANLACFLVFWNEIGELLGCSKP